MVNEIVQNVLSDNSNRRIAVAEEAEKKATSRRSEVSRRPVDRPTKSAVPTVPEKLDDSWIGQPCPLCKQGHIMKGNAAYGCSEWKNGCDFRKPF